MNTLDQLTSSIAEITIAAVYWAWEHGSIWLRNGAVHLVANKVRVTRTRYRAVLNGCRVLVAVHLPCNDRSHARVVKGVAWNYGEAATCLARTWIFCAWIAAYTQSCWKTGNETAQNLQRNKMMSESFKLIPTNSNNSNNTDLAIEVKHQFRDPLFAWPFMLYNLYTHSDQSIIDVRAWKLSEFST